jgi:hypothetical protein
LLAIVSFDDGDPIEGSTSTSTNENIGLDIKEREERALALMVILMIMIQRRITESYDILSYMVLLSILLCIFHWHSHP